MGGIVSRGGESVGGLVVTAYSFEGESEHQSDVNYLMVDSQGKFSFDALPSRPTASSFTTINLFPSPNVMMLSTRSQDERTRRH